MDTLTPEERSKLMSRIRGKNTKPEIFVRSMLHRAGYRFSLHRKELPGKPDIVLRKYKTVVFVHGCFWHRHKGCKTATTPKSNVEFWQQKFERNVSNDRKHKRELKKLGWNVIVVWECELKKPDRVLARLQKELTIRLHEITARQAENAEDNKQKILKPKVYSLKPSATYPAAEDTDMPIAAEEQAAYETKKKRRP